MVSYKEISFENLVRKKTVAVVGNSNSLFNKSFGSEIDSHDIVIRFNKPANFYCDYDVSETHGIKTDVWAFWSIGAFIKRILPDMKDTPLEKEFYENNNIYKIQATTNGHPKDLIELCDFTFESYKFRKLNKKLSSLHMYQNNNERRNQSILIRKSNIALKRIEPSVGITLIEWLTYCEPKLVNIYGMDFKMTPTFSEIERYEVDMKGRIDVRCSHNYALEELYAKKHIFVKNNYNLKE